jgi:hypothetical protein
VIAPASDQTVDDFDDSRSALFITVGQFVEPAPEQDGGDLTRDSAREPAPAGEDRTGKERRNGEIGDEQIEPRCPAERRRRATPSCAEPRKQMEKSSAQQQGGDDADENREKGGMHSRKRSVCARRLQ